MKYLFSADNNIKEEVTLASVDIELLGVDSNKKQRPFLFVWCWFYCPFPIWKIKRKHQIKFLSISAASKILHIFGCINSLWESLVLIFIMTIQFLEGTTAISKIVFFLFSRFWPEHRTLWKTKPAISNELGKTGSSLFWYPLIWSEVSPEKVGKCFEKKLFLYWHIFEVISRCQLYFHHTVDPGHDYVFDLWELSSKILETLILRVLKFTRNSELCIVPCKLWI